ncbi:MAG: molybdate ABC transporter permease subunit [Planctomycetota bacterium]|nr:molybdate ABC transporter permease subunit [Planctomycetota bacterium]
MDPNALWLTARLAVMTTAILLVGGVPLGYWLAHTKWRGRFLVEALVALPIILPPTVIGFYLLLAMGPASPLGRAVAALTGRTLPFTFTGILIGSVVYNLPFAVRPFAAAFAAVDRRLVEASWCLGVSRLTTFRRVVWPLAWGGILAGMVLVFAHSIGEFGVVLMLGGNIPDVTRTLSVAIYDNVQAMDYAAAHRTAAALMGFSFLSLCLVYAFQRRVLPT